MKWFSKVFGNRAANSVDAGSSTASISDIDFDTRRYKLGADKDRAKAWRSPDGDAVALFYENCLPHMGLKVKTLPDLLNSLRESVSDSGLSVVSMETCNLAGHRGLKYIFRMPQENHGFGYAGDISIPFESFYYHFRIECPEVGQTGLRESRACADAMLDGKLNIDSGGSVIKLPDGYSPDDCKYDAEFPAHPLSRLRRVMAHLCSTVTVAQRAANYAPYQWPADI
jgi:hypothetical protein